MGSSSGPSGGGDKNRGVEKGRFKQPAVAVRKVTPTKVVPPVAAEPKQPAPKPTPKPTPVSTAKVAFGAEVIDTPAAQAQLSARQKVITESPLAKIPTIGGVAAKIMGESNLARQKRALEAGGAAVAEAGTSFAPQGQRYTEAPGMRSSAELASQRFAVGTQGGEARQGPSGSIGQISATKPPAGSGMGYVGDVAGVVKTTDVMGVPVTTFTGKSGYTPTGAKIDKTIGGVEETVVAPKPTSVTQTSTLSDAAKKKRIAALGAGSGSARQRVFFGGGQ